MGGLGHGDGADLKRGRLLYSHDASEFKGRMLNFGNLKLEVS
jgi:hypothetical protein